MREVIREQLTQKIASEEYSAEEKMRHIMKWMALLNVNQLKLCLRCS